MGRMFMRFRVLRLSSGRTARVRSEPSPSGCEPDECASSAGLATRRPDADRCDMTQPFHCRTRVGVFRLAHVGTLIIALGASAAGPGLLAEFQGVSDAQRWSVAEGTVQVRCPLTVGGSFNAVTSAIVGRLSRRESSGPAYNGTLAVDLATLDTGIGLRNNHMRETYLEIDRGEGFAQAVLSDIELDTAAAPDATQHRVGFAADLLLHGVTQRVGGDAELRYRGERVEVRATFSISLEAFNIPPPRYLGVGVRDRVDVSVRFDAVRVDN